MSIVDERIEQMRWRNMIKEAMLWGTFRLFRCTTDGESFRFASASKLIHNTYSVLFSETLVQPFSDVLTEGGLRHYSLDSVHVMYEISCFLDRNIQSHTYNMQPIVLLYTIFKRIQPAYKTTLEHS